MRVEYINPFIQSTKHTFTTMLDDNPKPGRPVLKKQPYPVFDVSGVIGLSGDLLGNVVLSFPRITSLRVVSKFISEKIKVFGEEVTDGIAELANIVAGNALQHLDGKKVSISLPTIIMGKNHKITTPHNSISLIVPFQSTFGDFILEVSFKES